MDEEKEKIKDTKAQTADERRQQIRRAEQCRIALRLIQEIKGFDAIFSDDKAWELATSLQRRIYDLTKGWCIKNDRNK